MAAGPGEEIDAARYDWDWNSPSAKLGASWVPAATPMRDSIYPGVNKAHSADTTGDNPWGLVPDELPAMEYAPTETGKVVRTDLPASHPTSILMGEESAFITVQTGRSDFDSFPGQPVTMGGNSTSISSSTARPSPRPIRCLPSPAARAHTSASPTPKPSTTRTQHKGDRDEVARPHRPRPDRQLPPRRRRAPLFPAPLVAHLALSRPRHPDRRRAAHLESLTANFTAYPFEERASFHSGDPDLDKIWEISWRTARLDAHETYMDTPYYEQLQYVGDTRVQALISYAVAGDDRLAVQALRAFDQSRTPDGITRSRYPSSLPQSIPTFSLLWIGMVHDYWQYRPDPEPARASLPGTRTVLDWFGRQEHPDGLLHELPWWSFVDWVSSGTIPTYDANHESCVTTLEYLGALGEAADLERDLGDPVFADRYLARALRVRTGLYEKCWSQSRGLLADTPDQKTFSQQANVLAVLYDVVPKDLQLNVLHRMLDIEPGTTPDGILSASHYFRFYLSRALDHAGLAYEYLKSLDPWRKLLPLHFSTWPEEPGNSRSDSHAWAAHPIYDLLTLVAGIEPASPGFATVRIAPHLGALPALKATFPHPQGEIKVEYHWSGLHGNPQIKGGSTFHADIYLPGSVTGTFQFSGQSWPLTQGRNRIDLPIK